jgi:hypothetical protein
MVRNVEEHIWEWKFLLNNEGKLHAPKRLNSFFAQGGRGGRGGEGR